MVCFEKSIGNTVMKKQQTYCCPKYFRSGCEYYKYGNSVNPNIYMYR